MFMRQIAYLIALDKHRHFGRAAESCNVSQPALSSAISDMERELGITIVKRNRNFQGITPEGERVIAWARHVQASLHGLKQEAALVRDVPGGHLSIGTIPTAVEVASVLAGQYRRQVPALTVDIQSLTTSELLRRLQKQDLDVAITYPPGEDTGIFDTRPLYAERYVLVAHKDRMLPPILSWQDVADLPLALLSQDMQSRRLIDDVFKSLGLRIKAVVESNAIRILHEEASSGRACSIVPLSALPRGLHRTDVSIHPLLPQPNATVALMRLRRPQQSALSDLVWHGVTEGELQLALDQHQETQP
ncbi:LysR family transcriptional regulator [Acidisoma silvae]|uniref:LysR family transcriptional regulator n=1 Tax=Acidisoma silvae TaxID=2802396 RepID=A0A963YW36_9PROT|nr:LysR family transcriptional regulator [Acidisoma silvae]MCB8877929.1 LysR family transcriptional regulator [Acidisoma silvae]